jgi:hypothetical protein
MNKISVGGDFMSNEIQKQNKHAAADEGTVKVYVERGCLRVIGEIPVVSNKDALEAFVSEICMKLLGDGKKPKRVSLALRSKELTEADAAIYIGHSRSFLKKCRIYGSIDGFTRGPKFTRDTRRCIRYPIDELDKWLASRAKYETNCEVTQC